MRAIQKRLASAPSYFKPTGLVGALLGVAAVTLLIFPLKRVVTAQALDALYIPLVLWLTARWGVPIGVFATVLSASAFSYFHMAPVHAFNGLDSEGVAFLAVAVGAIYVANLSGRLHSVEERRRQEVIARGRVLAAADEERRRVVSDLHDGAQQRLVVTVIVLKDALRKLNDGDPEARRLVEHALEEAKQANRELREMAQGILPLVLTRSGLRAGFSASYLSCRCR